MVIPKLTRDLPHPFTMNGVVRTDDTLQAKAIREAITNMIIHSDLMLNGVLKVERYDDKFVFTNPGLLKLPIEQIYSGGETKARNQRIQNMFRMIGYGENLGSGFPLILNAWNEKHWVKPELVEQPELMQVKLTLYIQSEPINEPINDSLKVAVSSRQMRIISAIKSNPFMNREELAEETNLSIATLRREIGILRQEGYLSREGSNKNGQWIILKKGQV